MSLNFDTCAIADYETLCFAETSEGPRLRPLTHTLVVMSMSVGLGRITARNWRTWYGRARTVEALDGAWRNNEDGPRYLTPADVYAHIGLKTNVANETENAWRKRIVGYAVAEREQEAARWLTTHETEAA